jgi:hypothetical protein
MRLLRKLHDRPIFKRETAATGADEVIRWWETRRVFFNTVVGFVGVLTCVSMIVCGFVSEPIVGEAIGLPDPVFLGIFGILFYGILANVFYTSGWIGELFIRTILTAERASSVGLQAFRAGMAFSVALTLSPAVLCWIAFGIALAHGQTHGPLPE